MAERVTPQLVNDLDGSEAVGTGRFWYASREYEIDVVDGDSVGLIDVDDPCYLDED